MSISTMNDDLNILQNLAIPGFEEDVDVIQKLDDEPNDVGGLTAAELKAKFDEAGNRIKTYLNETLIPSISETVAEAEERAEAEAARVLAEEQRAAAEQERAAAEAEREQAEAERRTGETDRAAAESARKTAEDARALAEQNRVDTDNGIVAQATSAAEAAENAANKATSAAIHQPIIGDNGNWYTWSFDAGAYVDTGIYAGGDAPYIGENGNWYVGQTDTGVSATSTGVYVGSGEMPDGYHLQIDPNGEETDFIPYIGANGNWFVGNTDLEVPATGPIGPVGNTGATGPAGPAGSDGVDGKSAYQYAVEGGYTGTEEAFAAKMAAEIPAVDDTLTQVGQAADAAAVGEQLSNLSEEIANLGGGADVSVEPAEDDIPKVFFGGALQQTKDAAVVPFRYISKTLDIAGYAEIKAQGNSSVSYPKKNQTVKLFKDADCTEKLKVDFKGWGAQNKHVYKANWIDLSHARNVVSARLWADVVKSRSNYAELPELLRTSPNHGAVDGFPVKVYADGVYQGRYTLNIPKDKWAFNMDDTLDNHCVLCGENYASGCFRAAADINGNDWSDEIHDVVPESIKTRWNEVISFVMNSTDDEFKMNLGQYFDIPSLIDYHLFGLLSCGLDAYGKNQIYMTYDGQKWIASMYDMDSTWGLYWNGSSFVATDYARTSYEDYVNGQGNLLYVRLEQLFCEELQSRWADLKAGALSIDNIINRFERFTDITPVELVKEDYATTTAGGAFIGIPSQSTNNIQQIRDYALARQAWCDEYIAGLTSEEVPCTGISLSAETLTFTGTGTQTLTATVEPDGCTDTVTWASSDTSIATVSGGVITAVGNGDCVITATCGEESATCNVTVSGIAEGETSLLYSLPAETEFNGADTYIDTGVQLFDTDKDFSVFLDFYPSGNNVNSNTVLSAMLESSPYPGFTVRLYDYYGVSTSGLHSIIDVRESNKKRIKIIVKHTSGNNYLSAQYTVDGAYGEKLNIKTASGTFYQNVLLGCHKYSDGGLTRFWSGTIYACEIHNRVFSDDEISAYLNS